VGGGVHVHALRKHLILWMHACVHMYMHEWLRFIAEAYN